MRTIDADALLKKIDEDSDFYLVGDDENSKAVGCALLGVKEQINAMPTIETHGWIPCSEETGDGYPEEDGFYYVTEQNYGFYLDADYKQRVAHTSHFKNGDFTDRFYAENNSNITAWMPLPEPYGGEQE